MKLFLFFALSFFVYVSAIPSSCQSIGPSCKTFLNKTMSKLSTKFTSVDNIVCTISNDLGACIAQAKPFTDCLDVLASKSNSYLTKLALEKAAMFSVVTDFQSCLTGTKDLSMFDYLKKTLLVALKAKLKVVYNKKIQPKMTSMKNSGKTTSAMLEAACELGTAVATPNLISEITKKCMLLTYKATWQQCVMGKIVSGGVLTIGKFIKSTFKLKAAAPSG
ncbi:unnamed protein product, partial [Mesorhabditis belari]|uniref:Pectinesterase inhibitor domain-containing protein n=1 Tax=Mesorhabditis belari TaxID=2138241 RepID=A0AAF3F1M8_9BILA